MSEETLPRTLPTAMIAAVRALYEAYPYPRYPLLATPRWQDGYLTHSAFAAALVADLAGGLKRQAIGAPKACRGDAPVTVLIGGGGEILPYVIRKWEPSAHQVITVDLSAHSLRRARWRCFWQPRRTRFAHADLDSYLQQQQPNTFAHIDVYGVLHHMPNPSATLALIGSRLVDAGTLRLMVYNGEARQWIRHLQRLFALLQVDRFVPSEVRGANKLLQLAAAESPPLASRLAQLSLATLRNHAQFADTFLHPREARLSIAHWLRSIEDAGLRVVGLLDRYGELDDLPNPLWTPPTPEVLAPRAADGRFEHNLELFITRADTTDAPALPALGHAGRFWRLPYALKAPPRLWFSYPETRSLGLALRLRLWQAHLAWVLRRDRRSVPALLAVMPTAALQRLARIGAVLPGQIADAGRSAALACPLTGPCKASPRPVGRLLHSPKLHAHLHDMLAAKGRADPVYLQQALNRLKCAQE